MPSAKILLVEDSLVVAVRLTRLLVAGGYVMEHVIEAAKARRAVHSFGPDLIILDVGLPRSASPIWDGLDFLEWLHYMSLHVPVIIHSNTHPKIIQARHLNAHAVAYLQTPT